MNFRVAAAVLLIATAAPAGAQDAGVDVSGGIATSSFQGDYGRWHTYAGLTADISWSLSPLVRVVGDVTRVASSTDYGNGFSDSSAILEVAGGLRFTSRRDRRISGFGQVLAGADQNTFTLRTPGYPDYNGAGAVFVLDLGGGVEVAATNRIAVRGVFSAAIEDPWYSELWHVPQWKVRVTAVYRLGPH